MSTDGPITFECKVLGPPPLACIPRPPLGWGCTTTPSPNEIRATDKKIIFINKCLGLYISECWDEIGFQIYNTYPGAHPYLYTTTSQDYDGFQLRVRLHLRL